MHQHAVTTDVPDTRLAEPLAEGVVIQGPWADKILISHAHDADEVTVRWTGATSGQGMRMTGGIIRDPQEIAAIRRRVQAEAAGRGAWRRVLRRIRRGR